MSAAENEAAGESSDPSVPPTVMHATVGYERGEAQPLPGMFGRYRTEHLLGEGTFGRVYLAMDDELGRRVAVKVPHPHLLRRPQQVAQFLSEARTLAGLDHPHILPVYDTGRTGEGHCYVVSKYVDGGDLARRMATGRPAFTESARVAAAIARALHHAHLRGLVHRDVKPANVLFDAAAQPFLADFGLALREEDFGRGPGWAGTPGYMSPEQARGEGDRVDGRSDVFSLGVLLYELLTGRRPFRGDTIDDLLLQILTVEPRPPRQVDDTIPRELEQACLKALVKSAGGRYTTARDFAEDLERFLHTDAAHAAAGANRPDGAALLHLMWDHLDPGLQDAFLLAYNKKLREGKNRISTRDLFQALARVGDESLATLLASLPTGSMPEPIPEDVPIARHVLQDAPPLSSCVKESLDHFRRSGPLPRKLKAADLFVDIGKHGHGSSVARLRQHGVTAEELERKVREHGLPVLRRREEGHSSEVQPE